MKRSAESTNYSYTRSEHVCTGTVQNFRVAWAPVLIPDSDINDGPSKIQKNIHEERSYHDIVESSNNTSSVDQQNEVPIQEYNCQTLYIESVHLTSPAVEILRNTPNSQYDSIKKIWYFSKSLYQSVRNGLSLLDPPLLLPALPPEESVHVQDSCQTHNCQTAESYSSIIQEHNYVHAPNEMVYSQEVFSTLQSLDPPVWLTKIPQPPESIYVTPHQSCHLKSPSTISQPMTVNVLPSGFTTTIQEKILPSPSVINLLPIRVHNLIPEVKSTNSSCQTISTQKLPKPLKWQRSFPRTLPQPAQKFSKLSASKIPSPSTTKLISRSTQKLKSSTPKLHTRIPSSSNSVNIPLPLEESSTLTVPPPLEESSTLTVPPPLEESSTLTVPPPLEESSTLTVPPPLEESSTLTVPPSLEESSTLTVPPPLEESSTLTVPTPLEQPSTLTVPPPLEQLSVLTVPPPLEQSSALTVPPPLEQPYILTVPPPLEQSSALTVPPPLEQPYILTVPPPLEQSSALTVPPPLEQPYILTVPPPLEQSSALTVPPPLEQPYILTVPPLALSLPSLSQQPQTSLDQQPNYIFSHIIVPLEYMNAERVYIKLNLIPTVADVCLKQIPESYHDRNLGQYQFLICSIPLVNEILSSLNPKRQLSSLPSSKKPQMVSSTSTTIHSVSLCTYKSTFTAEIPESLHILGDNLNCVLPLPSTQTQPPNIQNSNPETPISVDNLASLFPPAYPQLDISNSDTEIEILGEYFTSVHPSAYPRRVIPILNSEIQNINKSCQLLRPIPGFEVKHELFLFKKLNKKCDTLYTQYIEFAVPKCMVNQLFCPKTDMIAIVRVILQDDSSSSKQPVWIRKQGGLTVSLRINDTIFKELFTGFESSLYIDVTPFLKKDESINSGMINLSFKTSPEKAKDIYVYISIVRKLSVQEILTELKEKTPISIGQTKNLIHINLGIDNLVNNTKLRESYICQLSKRPIKIPCRGIPCNHYRCFDAQYFFELNQNCVNLVCPICFIPLAYEDLRVDCYFQDLFKSIRNNNIVTRSVENDSSSSDNFYILPIHELDIDIAGGTSSPVSQPNGIVNHQDNIPQDYELCEPGTSLRISGFKIITSLIPTFFLSSKIENEMTCSKKFEILVPIEYAAKLFSSTGDFHAAKLRVFMKSSSDYKKNILPPLKIELQINEITVSIPSKYKTNFIIDITKILVTGNNSCIIKATIQNPSVDFILSCEVVIVKRLSTLQLMEELKTKPYIPFLSSKKLAINSMKDGIKEGINTNHQSRISVSLICPVGKTVVETPCKGILCQHFTCFDAMNFLKLNENSYNWICPICDIPLEFKDLRIDGLFQSVLKSIGIKVKDHFLIDIDGFCYIPTDEDQNVISTDSITTHVRKDNLSMSILPVPHLEQSTTTN